MGRIRAFCASRDPVSDGRGRGVGSGNVEPPCSVCPFRAGILVNSRSGVLQDYAEAARWYRKAAEQGNAIAQTNLGTMYFQGQGVPQDYAEAVRWCNLAVLEILN